MAAYCAASSSWRKAKPTVRNSAKISNPSKVQPRFEAISTFHWSRLSERYHGKCRAASWVDIDAPSPVHPRPSHSREAIGRFQRQYRCRRWTATTGAISPAVASDYRVSAYPDSGLAGQPRIAIEDRALAFNPLEMGDPTVGTAMLLRDRQGLGLVVGGDDRDIGLVARKLGTAAAAAQQSKTNRRARHSTHRSFPFSGSRLGRLGAVEGGHD